jgi:hypothetical protein
MRNTDFDSMVILLGLWRLVPLERVMQTDLARTLFSQRDHRLPGADYLTQNPAMKHNVVARGESLRGRDPAAAKRRSATTQAVDWQSR